MKRTRLISAVCTLLTEEEELHEEGLAAHLADQFDARIPSIFVAGSMGAMQLLTDETYCNLIRATVGLCKDQVELLAGAGDTGFARTRARIQFLNQYPLDGVVVLTPYFFRFSQEELIEYFQSLAAVSRAPLYLYDLPQVTGTKLQVETVLKLAHCPNIAGIKCSDDPNYIRQLYDRIGDSFRVIAAQADLVDILLRYGLSDHLDGMFAIAPVWSTALAASADRREWDVAAAYQWKLSALKRVLTRFGDAAFTAVLNARGIPGNFAPRPARQLTESEHEALVSEPIVQEYIRANVETTSAAANRTTTIRPRVVLD